MTPEERKAEELIGQVEDVLSDYIVGHDDWKEIRTRLAIDKVTDIIKLNALVEADTTTKFGWEYANPFWKKVLEVLKNKI